MAYYFPYWWSRAYPFIIVCGAALCLWSIFCPAGYNRWTDGLGKAGAGLLVAALIARRRKTPDDAAK